MSEPEHPTTYSARWVGEDFSGLPAASVAAMRVDDVRAAREETELAERAADQAEQLAFRMRGADTSLAGVFARAEAEARRADYRAEREDLAAQIAAGEVFVMDGSTPSAQRSELPATQYEADRLVRQHREDRSWMVAYAARHGRTDPETARRAAAITQPVASRAVTREDPRGREITRAVENGKNVMWMP